MNPTDTRGFLNNNPGNMDRGEPSWDGEIRDVSQCTNDVQRAELTHGRFCVFIDAPHGIRALVKNLRAYHDRLGARTIRDYINRWAPPNENNTAGYIARVAAEAATGPDLPINLEDRRTCRAIVRGIINVECAGMPYVGDEIEQGMSLAGIASELAPVMPPPAPLPPPIVVVPEGYTQTPQGNIIREDVSQSGIVKGANVGQVVTGAAGAVTVTAGAASQVKGLLPDHLSDVATICVTVIVLALLGVAFWYFRSVKAQRIELNVKGIA